MIASLPLFSQQGYWYHSTFFKLFVEDSLHYYVQHKPSKEYSSRTKNNKVLEQIPNNIIVSRMGQGMIVSSNIDSIGCQLYASNLYSSENGKEIIILPRITLCLKQEANFDMLLNQYQFKDVLLLTANEGNIYRYDCAVNNSDSILAIASILHQHPEVKWCEPVMKAQIILCNPKYERQWYLKNIGGNYGGVPGEDINVEPAWITTGLSNITVAVVDDGVEHGHEDLSNIILNGYTVRHPNGNGEPMDEINGTLKRHGTQCAGIIAAIDNNIGIKGAASGVKILPVNVLPDSATNYGYDDVAQAIKWAGERADVLSCSWHTYSFVQEIDSAIIYVREHGRNGKGTPVVCAGGSVLGPVRPVQFPASADGTIAVGSATKFGTLAPDSPIGPKLDVLGYGGNLDITTTDRTHIVGEEVYKYTNGFGGTSAACPQVASIIALMLSANPDLTESKIKEILFKTCKKSSTYHYINERNDTVGYGTVDAAAAVAASLTMAGSITPTPSSTYYVNNLSNAAHVSWSWKNSSSVPIVQDLSSSGNWCFINNTNKEFIKDYLVGTVYKGNDVVGSVEKYIHTGANFSGTYAQAASGNNPAVPTTSFGSGDRLLFTKGGTITLYSPSFSVATITHSGCFVQNWSHSGNTISFKFREPLSPEPLSPESLSLLINETLTITGTYANSYETFQFTVTGIDPTTPLLDITHEGSNYTFSMYIQSSNSEEEECRIALTGWNLSVIHSATGEVVYNHVVTDPFKEINTSTWDAGVYVVQAQFGDKKVTQKLNIVK